MKIDLKKITIKKLIIILGLIIFLLPIILSQTCIGDSLQNKGAIGDAVGGITAPFINAIAAILVFIAFQEQVKSNDLIKEQLYFQHIQDQINRLEDSSKNLSEITVKISDSIASTIFESRKTIGLNPPYTIRLDEQLLNEILYSTTIFNQTLSMIDKIGSDKEFLYKKLSILYKIIYMDNYDKIEKELNEAMKHNSPQILYIIEILTETKKLKENEHLSKQPEQKLVL